MGIDPADLANPAAAPAALAAAGAGNGGPEGGFVEYHFDDPTDETDRADIPKTGCVRTFTDQVQRADGSIRQFSFVVGSGFQGGAPETDGAAGDAGDDRQLGRSPT